MSGKNVLCTAETGMISNYHGLGNICEHFDYFFKFLWKWTIIVDLR